MILRHNARPHASHRHHHAANDNDPVKREYLRLAEAQDRISGLVLVTLKTGIKLSVGGRFFVVSRTFRADAKIARKTVYNHFRKLVAQGFLAQLEEGQGTFPAYRLTPLETWQQMLPKGGAHISGGCEIATRQPGKTDRPYTLRDPYDPEASQKSSAVLVRSEEEKNAGSIPSWLREAVVEKFGEAKAGSYLDPSTFDESTGCLDVRFSAASSFFYHNGLQFLRGLGVTLTYKGQPV